MRFSEEEKACITNAVHMRSIRFAEMAEDTSKSESVRGEYERLRKKYSVLYTKLVAEWI